MYYFRQDIEFKFRQRTACLVIGLTDAAMSNIINGKVACRKVVAYAITKYLNQDAEIEDYFIRKEN